MGSATLYHRQTSYARHDMKGHFLDWNNRPSVLKKYKGLETIVLPAPTSATSLSFYQLITQTPKSGCPSINVDTVSRLLFDSYRLTLTSRFQGDNFYYRNTPSAGALYPCELYLASYSVSGLQNGLYHYNLKNHSLTVIRQGDYMFPDNEQPFLLLMVSAIFFRSSWKYRDRSYRYHLLDSGHLTESIALAAQAQSLPFSVSYNFSDEKINRFLGVDKAREGCLALLTVPQADYRIDIEHAEPLDEAVAAASCAAEYSISYRLQEEMHTACAEIRQPDDSLMQTTKKPQVDAQQLKATVEFGGTAVEFSELSYERVMTERRSKRNFIPQRLDRQKLDYLLNCSVTRLVLEAEQASPSCTVLGLIAGDVEGLDAGVYTVIPDQKKLGLISTGNIIEQMSRICLDQNWLKQAAVHFFMAADLEYLDIQWGPRGYRYAMLDAGRKGHRIYLGATALGLGCCGIGAFYDEEAAVSINLSNANAMLYLLAVGQIKSINKKV